MDTQVSNHEKAFAIAVNRDGAGRCWQIVEYTNSTGHLQTDIHTRRQPPHWSFSASVIDTTTRIGNADANERLNSGRILDDNLTPLALFSRTSCPGGSLPTAVISRHSWPRRRMASEMFRATPPREVFTEPEYVEPSSCKETKYEKINSKLVKANRNCTLPN